MKQLVTEAKEVGIKLGVITPANFKLSQFVEYASEHLREHETSMLQDYRAGRELETGRILKVITMLAALDGVNIPVPTLQNVEEQLEHKLQIVRELPRDLYP
jgi:ketopantoate reductase